MREIAGIQIIIGKIGAISIDIDIIVRIDANLYYVFMLFWLLNYLSLYKLEIFSGKYIIKIEKNMNITKLIIWEFSNPPSSE